MKKDYIILEGKNVEKLIEQGLEKLNMQKEQVDIEIIEESKSIIGLFKKNYKIRITPKELEIEDESGVLENELQHLDSIDDQKGSFEISYKPDGVFLTVYKSISSDDILTKRIYNRINRKDIKDYYEDAVINAVREKTEEPVKIAAPQVEKLVNAEVVIEVSDNKMLAYMTLLSPLGGKDLSYDEALKIVQQKIKYGIYYEEIRRVVKEKLYNKKVLIAKGKEAIDGIDGEIIYRFDLNDSEKKVTIMEDGSVDFRNLNLITNVIKGDVLAEMVLPTKGEKGYSVTGEVFEPKAGKEVNFKYGKNVIISDDGLKLLADGDGQVTLEGDKVTVHEVYVVKGNVDNATGNIDFNGIVKINGNVRSGFIVKAEGDIEVNGVVEAAFIQSESNIILKRGMQGHNKGKLIAKGDIAAKYLENTYLFSDGNIKSDAIMHSEIYSKGTVEVAGRKGLLVGGVCKAKHEIHAKIIGSSMATATEIEVGVDPNVKAEYENIKSEIENVEKTIDKLDKSITLLNRLAQNNQLNNEKKQLLVKCINDRKALLNNLNELNEDLLDLENQLEALSKGRVLVKDVVYPGVKITIGKSIMFVKKELKHCSIYLDNGEIKVGPYGV